MRRLFGYLIVLFVVPTIILPALSLAGDSGLLGDRLRGRVAERDQVVDNVAGKTFFGNFITSCNETATSCMSFDREGNITWDQDLGSGPEVFSGQYREFKQGPNVFWGAVLEDNSLDGVLTLAGVAGANSTFMFLVNIDEPCPDEGRSTTAIGIYRRTDCTPGTRTLD
jgi:hypothetical protein